MEAKNLSPNNEDVFNEVLAIFGQKVVEVLVKQVDIEVELDSTQSHQTELPQTCEVESRVQFKSNAQRINISLCLPE